jgi:hypothetical protein
MDTLGAEELRRSPVHMRMLQILALFDHITSKLPDTGYHLMGSTEAPLSLMDSIRVLWWRQIGETLFK